jgi:hypothetical protein
MKTRSLLSHAILLCSLVLVFNASITAYEVTFQDKKPTTAVPEAEAKAAQAIEAATDVNAKFVAAEAFVKKYPAGKARPQVAQYLANQVYGVTEPNQRLAVAQKYLALFTDPTEAKAVKPALIDAYVQLKRFDEAFESGASYLANDAEDIQVRVLLAIAGAELARSQNVKHIKATRDYGTKAMELLEADTKSATMDNDTWLKGKAMLPTLYQQMAVVSLIEQKTTEAQTNLEKAAKLNPADPYNYALLGSITNSEYQTLAQTARGLPDGTSKNEMIQKATTLLDKVIEQYARAVALATGKPQYQPLRDQVMQDLVTYYKYRHNNSEEGLQKYIDGYKVP